MEGKTERLIFETFVKRRQVFSFIGENFYEPTGLYHPSYELVNKGPGMKIEVMLAYDYSEEIKKLFSEYTEMLVENDPNVAEYLELQNYNSELEHLGDKYGLPDGRLYIAKTENEIAGCIGLRKIDDTNCEMKRLYVRPAFRGHKIAKKLVEIIIDDAKKIGYQSMLLDTLPFLEGAIHLYKKLGFYEIESYNNSPMDTTIFMKLDLHSYESGTEKV